ncbi:MAG: arsenate reductase [Janthinobacterium lividum]
MTTLYGIPNCDTVKKARARLDARGLEYRFHDYKREGVPAERLGAWVARIGWEALLNTRGTTFRKLAEADREGLDAPRASALMIAHPSLIRRPVVEHGDVLLVGLRLEDWDRAGL